MIIKIELAILLALAILFITWAIWYRLSTKRLLKKYNPNNDKSKGGEEKRRTELAAGTGNSRIEDTTSIAGLPTEPAERGSLPISTPIQSGEVKSGIREGESDTGKTIPRPRKAFNPFRRK